MIFAYITGACKQAERKLATSTVPDLDNANVGNILFEFMGYAHGHILFSYVQEVL